MIKKSMDQSDNRSSIQAREDNSERIPLFPTVVRSPSSLLSASLGTSKILTSSREARISRAIFLVPVTYFTIANDTDSRGTMRWFEIEIPSEVALPR